MKIIRAIESFYPYMSGPANQAYRISKELKKKKIATQIFTSDYKAKNSPRHEKEDVEVFRFPIKFGFMKYFVTPSIKKKLEEDSSDLICAHSYRSYQTEMAYRYARKQGKPFVLHNHGSLIGYRSFVSGVKRIPYKVYDILHKKIALDADVVVVNTKQELGEVIKFGVPRRKIHVIPFGIDAEKYKPGKKHAGALNLLWVGRITKDRNIEVIIRAVGKIVKAQEKNKKIPLVKLKIVGNEYQRTTTDKESELFRLKELVKEMGLAKNVEFIPWSEKRAIKEFKSADIFIYTSLWENLGQTIVEAAASGLPLICTRVGAALDLIRPETGKLVGFDDVNGIAKGVITFSDKKKRKIAEKLLITHVKKEFCWKNITEKYIKLYSDLVKTKKSS